VPERHRRICGSVPVLRHTTTLTEPIPRLTAVASANLALASRSNQTFRLQHCCRSRKHIELRIDRLEVELQRELNKIVHPQDFTGVVATSSVLFTLIGGVVVNVGLLVAILRAGQSERVDFVVSDSRWDISVTGSPIEGAVHDRWPVDY